MADGDSGSGNRVWLSRKGNMGGETGPVIEKRDIEQGEYGWGYRDQRISGEGNMEMGRKMGKWKWVRNRENGKMETGPVDLWDLWICGF
jgi:hypothetical protein